MKNLIYSLLAQKLRTIEELNTVDYYVDQLGNNPEGYPSNDARAAYIDLGKPNTGTELGAVGIRQVKATFDIHICTFIADLYEHHAETVSFTHFDLENKVYQAIHHFTGYLSDIPGNEALKGTDDDIIIINTVTCTTEKMIQEFGAWLHTIHSYQFMYYDYRAAPQWDTLNLPLVVNTQIINP